MKLPELVLPAGDSFRAEIAYLYGADAVYLGMDKYSLRRAEVRFNLADIKKTIDYAHGLKKKVYLTFNIFAHNHQLKDIESDLAKVTKLKPDALIISDPGIIRLAKKVASDVPIHLSTQANTLNKESVRFWQNQGVKRIVLARELGYQEIKEIHDSTPKMELEIFVHGAMCISYSGRCLLSNYMVGREANLGDCAQPCRWNYNLYLEEKLRPGEYYPVSEDDSGTTILSSKDIKLIEHLPKIIDTGVSALKIEGRNKSEYYLATVAYAYKNALELAKDNRLTKEQLIPLENELCKLNNRGYTDGFFFGRARSGETAKTRERSHKWQYSAMIEEFNQKGCLVTVKNKLKLGSVIEILTPNGIKEDKISAVYDLNNKEVAEINPGKAGQQAYLSLERTYPRYSFIRQETE